MDNQIDYNKTFEQRSISLSKSKQNIQTASLRKPIYLMLALGLVAFWIKAIVVDGQDFFSEFMICTFIVALLLVFKTLDRK